MASALSPAQTISAGGQQLAFTCPANQLVGPSAAIIYNKSSYEITYLNKLIPAWGIVPVTLAAGLGSTVTILLTTMLAAGVAPAGVATVYVQWLDANEELPDEQSFTADAIAAAITSLNTQTELDSFSVAHGAGVVKNYSVPATTVGIGVLLSWSGAVQTTDSLQVAGVTSGQVLILVGGNPPTLGIPALTDNYYQGILAPQLDTAVQLSYQNNGAGTAFVTIIAYSQLPLSATHLTRLGASGISASPLIVSEGGPPWSEFTVSPATNTTGTLLALPTAGYVWEIAHLHLHGQTTVIGPATFALIKSLTGGVAHLLAFGTTDGLVADSDAKFKFNDGLSVQNATAVTVVGSCLARLMPDIR